MVHKIKLFFLFGPGVFEERHKLFFRLLILIPIAALVYHVHEIYESRSEFVRRPVLWLVASDCLVVGVEAFLLVCVALHFILRRISHPLPASRFVGIKSLPDYLRPNPTWRYSIVGAGTVRKDNLGRRDNGLEAFAAISESFATITAANPGLSPEARRSLYLDWYRLSPSAFLTLEHRNHYGGWSVVAISIVLPLNETGRDGFLEGKVTITSLRRIDVETGGGPPAALLVDTLIISHRFHQWTEDFAFPGLLVRHVARFWPRLPADWTVLVEPDDRKLEDKLLVNGLGFVRCETRAEGGPLYLLRSDMVRDGRIAHDIEALEANLAEAATWPLYVAGEGGAPAAAAA